MFTKTPQTRIAALQFFSYNLGATLFDRFGEDDAQRVSDLLQVLARAGDDAFVDEGGDGLIRALDALDAFGRAQDVDADANLITPEKLTRDSDYTIAELDRAAEAILTATRDGIRALALRSAHGLPWETIADDAEISKRAVRTRANNAAKTITNAIYGRAKVVGCGEVDSQISRVIFGLYNEDNAKEADDVADALAHITSCEICSEPYIALTRVCGIAAALLPPLATSLDIQPQRASVAPPAYTDSDLGQQVSPDVIPIECAQPEPDHGHEDLTSDEFQTFDEVDEHDYAETELDEPMVSIQTEDIAVGDRWEDEQTQDAAIDDGSWQIEMEEESSPAPRVDVAAIATSAAATFAALQDDNQDENHAGPAPESQVFDWAGAQEESMAIAALLDEEEGSAPIAESNANTDQNREDTATPVDPVAKDDAALIGAAFVRSRQRDELRDDGGPACENDLLDEQMRDERPGLRLAASQASVTAEDDHARPRGVTEAKAKQSQGVVHAVPPVPRVPILEALPELSDDYLRRYSDDSDSEGDRDRRRVLPVLAIAASLLIALLLATSLIDGNTPSAPDATQAAKPAAPAKEKPKKKKAKKKKRRSTAKPAAPTPAYTPTPAPVQPQPAAAPGPAVDDGRSEFLPEAQG